MTRGGTDGDDHRRGSIRGTFHPVGGAAEETPAAVIPVNRKPQRTPDRETDTSPGILLSPGERLDTLRGTQAPGPSSILMPCATWQPWVPLNNFRGWPGRHTRRSTISPLLASFFGRPGWRRGFALVPPRGRSIRDSHRPDWADHCHEARAGSCRGPYLHQAQPEPACVLVELAG